MKLAEALSIRADLQQKVGQLKKRMKNCVKTQEGDSPMEEINVLSEELDSTLKKLEELVFRINQTNITAMSGSGESLTQLIARKDVLSMRVSLMREVLNHAVENEDRYGRNEIKYVCNLDAKGFRKQTDSYARQLRELDLKIQEMNWTVSLI